MRIGIDARPLLGQRTGIGKFVEGLLDALSRNDHGHEFVLYAPAAFQFDPRSERWRAHVYRGLKGTNGTIWLQMYGRALALRDGVDVFWGPAFQLPVMLHRIPAVVTVHDLVHMLFPQTMDTRNYIRMKLLTRPSLWRAQHVTAASQVTAADLCTRLRVPADKITVVYPGVGAHFHARDQEETWERLTATLGISGRYVLTVATLEPRKNLTTLLRAFALMSPQVRKTWPLVIAGGVGWKYQSIYKTAAPMVCEGTVRFLGYVPDADLPWLYAGATLFLFPSLYEGFGMPIAEAMASGAPVIASDIPVVREVAANAAVLVEPLDVERWAGALDGLLHDGRRIAGLRDAGLQRARRFTFDASAGRLLEVIERTGRDHYAGIAVMPKVVDHAGMLVDPENSDPNIIYGDELPAR